MGSREAGLRVLLTGATGLIGSAVLARLHAGGHQVVAVVRRIDRHARRLPAAACIALDFRQATTPDQWLPHLRGVDAVVNCAGVFQDSPRDSTSAVHTGGAAALFAACQQAGVRRVVHVSAIGADADAPTRFTQSKHQGEEALMRRDLDWVILRPSVVVGRPAYGGSAMFRGLAALPITPSIADTGLLQIVQLDDLVATVEFFLSPDAPTRRSMTVAGPQPLGLTDVIRAYRRWLGYRATPLVAIPHWLANAMYRLGDAVSLLGWRPPLRSTARQEMVRGAVGDPTDWTRLTGIAPRALGDALAAEPASVQEHWFAQLYFLKPLVIGVYAFFWIATAVVALGPGFDTAMALMQEAGAGTALAAASVIGGALTDIVIGTAMIFRRTARRALYAALGVSLFYMIVGSIILPRLWFDPIGPMLKMLPVLMLNLVALATLDER
jgi:uncharacterized protein YbjT (DUF2867 family)